VAFTFQSILLSEIGHNRNYFLRKEFGPDNKSESIGIYSFNVIDEDGDNFNETISFNFVNELLPVGIGQYQVRSNLDFERIDLLTPLLPVHILGDPINHGFNSTGDFDPINQWIVPLAEWRNHSYNTRDPSDPGGLNGPIGCGPLIFKIFDPDNGIITYQKFEDIQWDNISQVWDALNTSSDHFLVKASKLDSMPTIFRIIATDLDSALNGIKTGEINIVESSYFRNLSPKKNNLTDLIYVYEELKAEGTIKLINSANWIGYQIIWLNPKLTTSTELGENDRPFNKKGVRHAISHIIPRELINEKLRGGFTEPAYTPFAWNFWGSLSVEEMIAFKKSLQSTDGSYPEANAIAAWDSYDPQLALDWLETEGYDVDEWRLWTQTHVGPATPDWVGNDAQQWHEDIKKGAEFTFKITKLRDNDGINTWFWEDINITFNQNDEIVITWLDDPAFDEVVGSAGPVTYPISVSIGGNKLEDSHAQQFGWFILPLVTTDGFGEKECGIREAERFFLLHFSIS
jgi:hypothetical protein